MTFKFSNLIGVFRMSAKTQKTKIIVPPCPDCKAVTAHRRGPGKKGEMRFTCKRCGRHYSPKSRPMERGPVKIPCPECGSDQIHRRGFGDRGARKYSCRQCGKNFSPEGGRIDPKLKDIIKNLIGHGLGPGQISRATHCSYYIAWKLRRELKN
jgi:transposase-like protein